MNFAIILSGGIGKRMQSNGIPKQYLEVENMPIISYTLLPFEACQNIEKIVIVAAEEWKENIKKWCAEYKISKLADTMASAGSSRQESILNGLRVCMQYSESENDLVIIHDAVRPLITTALLDTCILSVEPQYDGCMPVLPVKDTIYQSQTGKEISQLLDRNLLYAGQAPEVFRLKKYYTLNSSVTSGTLTNTRGSSEIAFQHGMNIRLIPGDENNYKLTTPEDLARFKNSIGAQNESI